MTVEALPSPEMEREFVVEKNLAKMKTEMLKFLVNESLSGNAGQVTIDGKVCDAIAANCYVKPGSAEIVRFSNRPRSSREQDLKQVYFILAFSFDRGGLFKIDRIESRKAFGAASAAAAERVELTDDERSVLDEAVERWNSWREIYVKNRVWKPR